ncbi:hypothetical protein CHF27_012530 [Romboutsia maritimum]|uniref:Cthe-2314-like HEPN domain-containing protein n=1 Tax=Romboutsia maritimum TaxID=2020948 RepID=A0A371IQ31_9FIRM|nr:hypothetical protein [Romboutsia maritimum]RDY22597.1 hypothetical protein CHF27_012530 [Romboutsia maritimum]
MTREDLKQLDSKLLGEEYFNKIFNDRCQQLDVFFNRMFDMHYIFAGANFNLAKAANEDINIDEWETDNPEVLKLFLRTEYLKSCILSYNSIEDYIMKVVVFSYNLKGKRITSRKDFIQKCKNMYYQDVLSLIKRIKSNKKIKKVIQDYHKNNDVKKLRGLANQIKHNNNIRFNGFPKPSYIRYRNKTKIAYDSNWTEPYSEDIDDIVNMCYRLNDIIKKYIEDVYDIVSEKYNFEKIHNN